MTNKTRALAKDLRPLVDAWDEIESKFGLSRMQAAMQIEILLGIAANTGIAPVYSEIKDGWTFETGVWEACKPDSIRELLDDLGCSDYASGMDSRRAEAAYLRVRHEDYPLIIEMVSVLLGQFNDDVNAGELQRSTPLRNEYPAELQAAIEAFEAVRNDPVATAKQTPKAALSAWLEEHKPEIKANARDRISTVANWIPQGGAPKTPGS